MLIKQTPHQGLGRRVESLSQSAEFPSQVCIHDFQTHVPYIFQMFSAFYSFWGLWEHFLGGYRKALQTQPLMGWQGITSWHLRVASIMMHNLRAARCLLQCKGKPDLYGTLSCSVVVKNKNQQQQQQQQQKTTLRLTGLGGSPSV